MQTVPQAFGLVWLLGLFGTLMFFVPLWGHHLVFRRMEPDSNQSDAPNITYSLADILVLTAFLAIGTALGMLLRNEMTMAWLTAFTAIVNIFVMLLWFQSQQFMNRHGIRTTWIRALVQVILFPSAIVLVGVGTMALVLLLTRLEVFEFGLLAGTKRYLADPLNIAAMTTLPVCGAACLVLRRVFRRLQAMDAGQLHGKPSPTYPPQ